MIAESPPLPAQVFAPGKESEIAELAQKAADTTAEKAALTASLTDAVQKLSTALPAENQSELLTQLAQQLKQKSAALYVEAVDKLHIALPVTTDTTLKDHPAWEDYQISLQAVRERKRKEAELLYPNEEGA